MTAIQKLIDAAKYQVEGESYAAIARRLQVTPQTVHQWKRSEISIPAERIAEIAKIARFPADNWVLLVMAEQTKGIEKKTWESVVRRLGIAAAIALAVGYLPGAGASQADEIISDQTAQSIDYAKCAR